MAPPQATPELICPMSARGDSGRRTDESGTFHVLQTHGGQYGALERYEFRTRFCTGVERATTVQPTTFA